MVQVTSPGMPMILTFSLKDSPSRISSGVPSGNATCRVIHCPYTSRSAIAPQTLSCSAGIWIEFSRTAIQKPPLETVELVCFIMRISVAVAGAPSGKVVAVTGAGRGIGRATADALVRAGARVALGDVDAEAAVRAADELGDNALGLPLDVTDEESFGYF